MSDKRREMVVDGVRIGDDTDCYVIAEIGHNHQGDLDKAKALFAAAAESGADAVKLQKRDNRGLYTPEKYNSLYDNRNSFGRTYGEHREFLEFGREEYIELQAAAGELGVTFFATAFDISSAEFLAELDMPAYKIASGDLRSVQLLQHVARIGKPMIISTGGGTLEDVQRAAEVITDINPELCILQCTAGYPCEYDQLDLRVIETYRQAFPEQVIGLSGHDNGIAMAPVSYLLGARVLEKHFTLNRTWKGTDHAFSLAPAGFKRMIRDLRRTRLALGDGVKRTHETEHAPIIKMSKKLVAKQDIPAGHQLSIEDIAFKSPGDGMHPYELTDVIGRTTTRAISQHQPLAPDAFA